jgi:hypothetical protein
VGHDIVGWLLAHRSLTSEQLGGDVTERAFSFGAIAALVGVVSVDVGSGHG